MEAFSQQPTANGHQLIANLQSIQQRINAACARCGRDPAGVQLLLATKTIPAERIKAALQSGVTLIAENRIQELREKFEALRDVPHTNHFIGHLQTNKVKDLLKYDVICLHSLDRMELAEKLSARLQGEKRSMDILVQVNTSGEESKFGIDPNAAVDFIAHVAQFKCLRVKGLMTIGLFSSDLPKVRACFQRLAKVRQEVMTAGIEGVEMKELSMGMSSDLEAAVEEGATIVRVGTAVFGKRSTPDSYYWPVTGC